MDIFALAFCVPFWASIVCGIWAGLLLWGHEFAIPCEKNPALAFIFLPITLLVVLAGPIGFGIFGLVIVWNMNKAGYFDA